MEGISETVSVKRRGRPRILSAEHEQVFNSTGAFDNTTTRRGRMDAFYRIRAMQVLKNDYRWLADRDAIAAGGTAKAWRPTILAELGRVANEDTLRLMADWICHEKPPTRTAVQMVRRARRVRPAANRTSLGDALFMAAVDYINRYPETTDEDIYKALEGLYKALALLSAERREYAAKKKAVE